jgi:hypothetical protein
MDKFKEIRDKIGKDLIWRLPKANKKDEWGEIVFDWKFNISIQWYIHEVGDKFRTNSLSNIEGQYTIINFSKEQKGRIYTNVHNYVIYALTYFRIPDDFDFIYAWDNDEKKLIVVWENDRENKQYQMDKEFAKSYFGNDYKKKSQHHNLRIV